MTPRFQFGGFGKDRGFWTVLAILLPAVLLPTAGLLYFINEAVNGQRDLARQRLGDAYRGQLRLVSERLDAFWEQRARDLDSRSDTESPAVFFEHCVRDGLADSVICLNHDGSPAYPALAAPPLPDPTAAKPLWQEARRLEDAGKPALAAEKYDHLSQAESDPALAARAAQAYVRCLVAEGRKQDAIDIIEARFFALRLSYANDLDGRLIVGDEQLLQIQLLPPGDARARTLSRRLHGLLENYSRQIPAAQRLFLMDQLRALYPNGDLHVFTTYAAERMAERCLSNGQAVPGASALQSTGSADIWKYTSPGGRTIGLYSTASIAASLRSLLDTPSSPRDPVFRISAPGGALPQHLQAMGVGSRLPGWQITMNMPDPGSAGLLPSRQIAGYLWIGFLTIATVAVLAIVGAQLLRRQMRIADLKTDLVAAVSHELRTPLASMKLLVESLLSSEQMDPKRTRQYLQLVARENSRLSRLIDNFLTFSRMERNRGKFDLARVQPEAIVNAAVESVGDRFAMTIEVSSHLPPLYADGDALVTVLLNLLDNAFKYTGEDRRIELRAFSTSGRVCFAVKDNGVGIAEREQRKIFRRFYQVDRRLARPTGGVGLGLSIVEFIVKAHHGDVSVVSRPGSGSTFTVSLPPSTSAAGAAA